MEQKKLLTAALSICMVLLLATLTLMAACTAPAPPAPPAAEKTLKIGVLVSLTGWYSVIDAAEVGEVQEVAKMINDKGGITIDGQKYLVELVIEDCKSTFDGVAAAANRLVYDKGVKFDVGPSAFWNSASSPIFEQNKVLHVLGYATSAPGELDASTPYGFLGHNCTIADAIAAIRVIKKEFPDVKKVAISIPDEGTMGFVMPNVIRAVELQGITVVGETVGYSNEIEDLSPIAAKLNAIKDADAYFLANGAPPHLGGILKGLREQGNDKPCVSSSLVSCHIIGSISGKAAANNAFSLAITPNAPGNPALLNEICDRLQSQYEQMGGIYMMDGNSLWVLTRIIEAAQSLDPTVVKAKWESMDKVETLLGTGILGGEETYGLKNRAIGHPIPYQKLMNGEVSPGGWVDVGVVP